MKYSGATEIQLRIHRRNHGIHVVVEDDGKGFELAGIDSSRNGLANMVERMKEVGGTCRITTKPGTGCRVEFQIPLPRNHAQPLIPATTPASVFSSRPSTADDTTQTRKS